ncbi:MAG: sigma-70 family RNA polymerase sigma factor [Polyangiaceae bacterium]
MPFARQTADSELEQSRCAAQRRAADGDLDETLKRADREQIDRWMTALADGDRNAFAPLYAALWPRLRAFAARALPSSADAEDAAQSALLRVFSRAAEFDGERDACAWVLGIVAWECRTLRKRAARRREIGDASHLDGAAAPGADPEAAALARDLEAAARAAFGDLRPADQDTLRRAIAGERPPDGGPTFRKRLERAIARLRGAWRSTYGTE